MLVCVFTDMYFYVLFYVFYGQSAIFCTHLLILRMLAFFFFFTY